MNLAPKKVIIIIQLLFLIVNEVNCAPLPRDGLLKKVWNSIKDTAHNVISFGKDKIQKLNPLKNVNCFSFAKFFHPLFSIFFNDITKEESVIFYFSSRRQPINATVTVWNNTFSLKGIDFNPQRSTVVILHGFVSSGKEQWVRDMTDAFFRWGDVNVIVVDWEKGSNTYHYLGAAASTQVVGDEIAKLFSHIRDDILAKNISRNRLGKLHFVGHSLGAHIVARAANKIMEHQNNINNHKSVFRANPWLVTRITGLDPAQPCFLHAKDHEKLDENDAEFVDVIHTNGRPLALLGFGLPERIGYVDFYPNGGQMQPGCPENEENIWHYILMIPKLIMANLCSHGRAYIFFTDSILRTLDNKCTYISHRWDRTYDEKVINRLMQKNCTENDCPNLGINSIISLPMKKGIYFTPTGHEEPYCVVQVRDDKLIRDQLQQDDYISKNLWITGK